MQKQKKFICIHGHFYQPPRENPWLEVVEAQESASPFHDWNERVCAECYAPNAAARILGAGGTIQAITNNYSRISFNFGPTLLVWLERHAPDTYAALLAADRQSRDRWGHGNALAQVYNHLIMPLATSRDKKTQVHWGVRDFQRRFGRRPEGMWLAETAVDLESLQCLADEGIKFTILSPSQAQAARPSPSSPWSAVADGGLDPRRPYRVALPSGGEIAVFFYDGPLSRSIAFEHLLDDGAGMARRVKALLDPDPVEPQIVTMATDGESYGHHHRFGEMALAYALKELVADPQVELTNFAAFLEANPPVWEVRVLENSSWSCAHGVERWKSDCGCAIDTSKGWNQRWRAPLRQGLDRLRQRLDGLFEDQAGQLFNDPWAARDDYVELLGQVSPLARAGFLARHQKRPLNTSEAVRACKLLESQHWGMYMFTSCAWFFDDISGIEPVQNLRFAARAIQLAEELDGGGWEDELLKTLATAQSNLPREGNGALIWQREVGTARVGFHRVAAHAVISGVMGEEPPPEELYCYQLQTLDYRHRHELGLHLSWGRLKVSHLRVGQEHDLVFAVLFAGGHEVRALVGPATAEQDLDSLGRQMEQPLRLLEQRALWEILVQGVPGKVYGMADLFMEGRRLLASKLVDRSMAEYRETANELYRATRETMLFLREISVPLPRVFTALAEVILSDDLVRHLDDPHSESLRGHLGEVAMQAKALGLSLSGHGLRLRVEKALTRDLEALARDPQNQPSLVHAEVLLNLAEALGIQLDLWGSQNHFYGLIQEKGPDRLPAGLLELGRRLHFALDPDGQRPA
ncbi:MAG: DUF3536 domain-containing protein [Pseudomonadota bacterium]